MNNRPGRRRKWLAVSPCGHSYRDSQGKHEAHGVGGLIDGHGRELALCIWQQPSHHDCCLTRPPFRDQQHACMSYNTAEEEFTLFSSSMPACHKTQLKKSVNFPAAACLRVTKISRRKDKRRNFVLFSNSIPACHKIQLKKREIRKNMLFSGHSRSLLRRHLRAMTMGHSPKGKEKS